MDYTSGVRVERDYAGSADTGMRSGFDFSGATEGVPRRELDQRPGPKQG